mmetsp:Transcript_59282/g.191654  ORF Transcript_59282/g.191654 Transcript_59282/m.191654 type:complete len:270 (+) Transcript_59282:650-1459(+)
MARALAMTTMWRPAVASTCRSPKMAPNARPTFANSATASAERPSSSSAAARRWSSDAVPRPSAGEAGACARSSAVPSARQQRVRHQKVPTTVHRTLPASSGQQHHSAAQQHRFSLQRRPSRPKPRGPFGRPRRRRPPSRAAPRAARAGARTEAPFRHRPSGHVAHTTRSRALRRRRGAHCPAGRRGGTQAGSCPSSAPPASPNDSSLVRPEPAVRVDPSTARPTHLHARAGRAQPGPAECLGRRPRGSAPLCAGLATTAPRRTGPTVCF